MSRSSLLSAYYQQPVSVDIPQLPGWVTGGAFNQIERDILSTNAARAQLESQRQSNELNDFRLQQAELEQGFNENLSTALSGNPTTDLRKTYELAMQEAIRSGVPMQALKFQDGITQLDRQERLDRNDAMSRANNFFRIGAFDQAKAELLQAGIPADNVVNKDTINAWNIRNSIGYGGGRVAFDGDGNPIQILPPAAAPRAPSNERHTNLQTGATDFFDENDPADQERIKNEGWVKDKDLTTMDKIRIRKSKEQAGEFSSGTESSGGWFSTPRTGEPEAKKQQDLVDGLAEKYGKPGTVTDDGGTFEPRDGTIIRSKKTGKQFKIVNGQMVPYEGR